MKISKLYCLILVLVTISVAGCKDFLEQSSQDLVRPTTVSHYKELLQGEAYFKQFYRYGWFVDVMTDDILTHNGWYSLAESNEIYTSRQMSYVYQWAADIEADPERFTDQLFKHLYKNILTANTCLSALENETLSGTEQEVKTLKGQALFTRAYGYFVLANLYAQAYNEASPADLCVPLLTKAVPTLERAHRATIKEVWDLISSDIEESIEFLATTPATSYYEINYEAALLLASRIFLYKEDYDKSIHYGELFLSLHPALRDIRNESTAYRNDGSKNAFLAPSNPEIVFAFSDIDRRSNEGSYLYYQWKYYQYGGDIFTSVSNDLYGKYEANDRRKWYWFLYGDWYWTFSDAVGKFSFDDGLRKTQVMRSGEVYLNLAEAYARKSAPEMDKSIALLNTLRDNRIVDYTPLTATNFSNQEALVNFVLKERRLELCFEEFHRWWDLRRTGQPSISHVWAGEDPKVTYVLQEHDPAYILNFPKYEREYNPDLVPNPRPIRLPQD